MLRMLGINHGFPVWEGEDGSENCRSKAEAETREGGSWRGQHVGVSDSRRGAALRSDKDWETAAEGGK